MVEKRLAMIHGDKLYDYLFEQGLQPEMVEEDTEITICCPLCDDDRPRLYVSADTGAWHCFHCHEEGGLHVFLMRVCDLDGPSAMEIGQGIRSLEDEDGFDYFSKPKPEEKAADAPLLRLPPQFHAIDAHAPEQYLKYLAKRHVSPELAASRGIGYAVTGRYGRRIIIPMENDGVLYTFYARTTLNRCPCCQEKLDECRRQPRKFPKVLTPLSKEGARPSHGLFNLDAVRRAKPPAVIVVEGAFDALRRPHESVALGGSSASATQITLLSGLARAGDIILCLDGDKAGYAGALKIADALTSEMVRVRVALLPEGTDPGSLSSEELDRCLARARKYVI